MDEAVLNSVILELKKEALKKGRVIALPTTGRSMFPFLTTNNKIELIKYDTQRLEKGDIIVYKSNDKLIAHRLVRKIKAGDNYLFVTKGDTCFSFDRPINSDAIIGKVIKIRKANFYISLDTIFGKLFSLIMFFLSVSKILASGILILRKAKCMFKSNAIKCKKRALKKSFFMSLRANEMSEAISKKKIASSLRSSQ